MQTTWEGKLRRESVFGRQHPSLELARMPLHLIAMLVDAPKEVCAAMNIEHYAVAFGDSQLLPRVVVLAHLDPLGLECCAFASPLPPIRSSDCLDAFRPQLCVEEFC